jgi:hypothetical protein
MSISAEFAASDLSTQSVIAHFESTNRAAAGLAQAGMVFGLIRSGKKGRHQAVTVNLLQTLGIPELLP